MAKNIQNPSGSLTILIDQDKHRDTTIIKRFTFFYDYNELIGYITSYFKCKKNIIIGSNCYNKKSKTFFGFDKLFSINKASYIISFICYKDDFSLNYVVISSKPYIYLKENNEEITKNLFEGFSHEYEQPYILKKYFKNYNSYLSHICNNALNQNYNLYVYRKKTDKVFIDKNRQYVKDLLCNTEINSEDFWNDFYMKNNVVFFDLKFDHVFFITQNRIVSSFFTVNTILYEMRFDQKVLPLDFLSLYVLENESSIILIDKLDKNCFISKLDKKLPIIQDKYFIIMNIIKNFQLSIKKKEHKDIDRQIIEDDFIRTKDWSYFYLENRYQQFTSDTFIIKITLGVRSIAETSIIVYNMEHKNYQKFDRVYLVTNLELGITQSIQDDKNTTYTIKNYLPDNIYALKDIQSAGISPVFTAFIFDHNFINDLKKITDKYIYDNADLNIKEHFSKDIFYLLTGHFYGPVRMVFDLSELQINVSRLIELSKNILEIEKDGKPYYLFHLIIINYNHVVGIKKKVLKNKIKDNEYSKLSLYFEKSNKITDENKDKFSVDIYLKSENTVDKLSSLIAQYPDDFSLHISFFISKDEWLKLNVKCKNTYLEKIDGLFYLNNTYKEDHGSTELRISQMIVMCAYGDHKVYFREPN